MDNGMGRNGGNNGILMEDEILATSTVSTVPQAGQTVQPRLTMRHRLTRWME